MAVFILSNLTYVVSSILILAIGILKFFKSRDPSEVPGPMKWPIIGNLHLLRGYKLPYQGFVDLSKKFGNVYSLQLGSVSAVVVQGVENIREVLIHKCHHFDSRPNFNRYHQLFHGNKENSLAFCDWSNLQKKRRDLLKDHVFPKVYSNSHQQLNRLICDEINKMIEKIKDAANNNSKENVEDVKKTKKSVFNTTQDKLGFNLKHLLKLAENKHVGTIVRFPRYLETEKETKTEPKTESRNVVSIKDRLLPTCANIFLRYFCSADLEHTEGFQDFVESFDKIFYEVNQGYVYDFLPFLSVFFQKDIKEVQKHSEDIRKFVLRNIIKNRMVEIGKESLERDYVDALLKNVKYGKDVQFNMETALFSLEDIIGGHSAIGNFLVKLLTFLVDNKTVQEKIREEVKSRGKSFVTLEDRCYMPYTEAVIMEALRMLSSPIVPHVSNQDTSISGYSVKKNTLVFLNNYELNMSESLWTNPREFDPTRFINTETGMKTKPAHFLPFGGGKRSCMGYKLVQFISFVFVANVVNNFDIRSVPGEKYNEVTIGNLALPTRTYKFEFLAR